MGRPDRLDQSLEDVVDPDEEDEDHEESEFICEGDPFGAIEETDGQLAIAEGESASGNANDRDKFD